jgi:hypothetical protein
MEWKMRKTVWVSLGCVVALSFSIAAEAKLYKWVDKNGETHYSETIPPEYADQNKETLSKSGLIQKKVEKPDPNALKAKKDADIEKKREQEAEMEIKRRNNTLLNTYSNEHEIDLARDRSLVLVNARIDSNKILLKSSQDSLNDLHKEADSRTKSGKKIPASLTNDISQMESRIKKYQEELTKGETELQEVKDRFAKEKELYRQIKGGNAKK